MALVKVGPASKLPPGSMLEFRTGDRQVAICNVGGQFHAIDNECPHHGGPLAQGALHGKMVVCPFHAWEFDCTTGECDFNPAIQVKRYTMKVEGGELFVDM